MDGTTILAEFIYTWEDGTWYEYATLVYLYDENGAPIGMRGEDAYGNQSYYYYEKNLQGDVIAVLDSNGSVVASYVYDAWGRVLETEYAEIDWESASPDQVFFERLNPFLYRGYYYDAENEYYYLNSRYYNPAWGRFINAE